MFSGGGRPSGAVVNSQHQILGDLGNAVHGITSSTAPLLHNGTFEFKELATAIIGSAHVPPSAGLDIRGLQIHAVAYVSTQLAYVHGEGVLGSVVYTLIYVVITIIDSRFRLHAKKKHEKSALARSMSHASLSAAIQAAKKREEKNVCEVEMANLGGEYDEKDSDKSGFSLQVEASVP